MFCDFSVKQKAAEKCRRVNIFSRAVLCFFALSLVFSVVAQIGCAGTKLDFSGKSGEVSNIVIPVAFKDGDGTSGDFFSDLNEKLFNEKTGLVAFFKAESLGKCKIDCFVADEVTVSHTENYYRKSSLLNSEGYAYGTRFGKENVDYFYREQTLIREILSLANIPEDLVSDRDGDGYADGITFVFNASFENRFSSDQKIMWPHKSRFYAYGDGVKSSFFVPENYYEEKSVEPEEAYALPKVNGAVAHNYNIVSADSSAGDMCHEFSHVLGLPDYYSYTDSSSYDYIGGYELLGRRVGDIPQYSLAYVRSKLGWLTEGEEIVVLSDSEEMNLYPVTHGEKVAAIKIIPPDFEQKREFFMIEAREKKDGGFDCFIEASGVIVYRVNELNGHIGSTGALVSSDYGNMYGDGNYEVAFVRSSDPMLPLNYFTEKEGRSSVGELTYSDGTGSGVTVNVNGKNENGGYVISAEYSRTAETEKKLPSIYKKDGAIAFEWSDGEDGKTVFSIIEADGLSSAANAMSVLPDAVRAANENGAGYKLLSVTVKDSRSGFYVPAIDRECYVLSAKLTDDGKVTDKAVFHIRTSEEERADFTYSDFLKVAFMRGNPAYVASWCIGGACVLAVVAVVLFKRKKKKQP